MDIESEDFLNPAVEVEEVVAAEPVAETVEEPVASAPERGPDGKFAAKAKEPDAPANVPLGTLLDEREKRQAAEARAKALEERIAAQQPPTPPDPAQAAAEQRYADNLRFSRRFAEREYGKDVIATVHDWAAKRCDADPFFNASMKSAEDPYEAAYQAYNRDQIAAKVSPQRLAQFEAWETAQAALQASDPTPSPQPSAPTPPRSLAEAPGTGLSGKNAGLKSNEQVFADQFP
jgi:hypothetical protein